MFAPFGRPTNQSYNKTLKELHSECYKIILDAIEEDERSGDKTKAIELYKKGLKALEKALAIKSDEQLTDKARTLIESMHKNKKLVTDRLEELDKEKSNASKLTKMTSKLSNGFKSTTTSLNRINTPPAQSRNRPLSSQSSLKNKTNELATSRSVPTKNCLNNKNDLSNDSRSKNLSNLSNLKGIDKRILDLILDNIYSPTTKIKFNDISGLHIAKQALREIVVWPMQNPELFTGLREPSRGVLFFGPPGCGKTLLAKSLANESNSTFLSITASSLTSKWLGESEKLVKALFSVARELKPSILFIDEIDSLLSERKENESEATRRIKTEFFIELDGLKSENNNNVFVLAATNVPYSLDEAALRRFPKRIFINLPDLNARKELFNNLLAQQNNPLNKNEIDKLADLTEGYSASDITALAKDAALGPIRELCGRDQQNDGIKNLKPKNVRKIKIEDFLNSLNKIRKSCVDSSVEKLNKWNQEYGDVSI